MEYCCCRARLRPMNLSLIMRIVADARRGFVHAVRIDLIEHQGLDQQAGGIDDLEQLIAGAHHLARYHARGGDDAVDRRTQVLRAALWQPAVRGGASRAPPAGYGCPRPRLSPRRC